MEDPVKCCEKCGISGSVVEVIRIKQSQNNAQNTNKRIESQLISSSTVRHSEAILNGLKILQENKINP